MDCQVLGGSYCLGDGLWWFVMFILVGMYEIVCFGIKKIIQNVFFAHVYIYLFISNIDPINSTCWIERNCDDSISLRAETHNVSNMFRLTPLRPLMFPHFGDLGPLLYLTKLPWVNWRQKFDDQNQTVIDMYMYVWCVCILNKYIYDIYLMLIEKVRLITWYVWNPSQIMGFQLPTSTGCHAGFLNHQQYCIYCILSWIHHRWLGRKLPLLRLIDLFDFVSRWVILNNQCIFLVGYVSSKTYVLFHILILDFVFHIIGSSEWSSEAGEVSIPFRGQEPWKGRRLNLQRRVTHWRCAYINFVYGCMYIYIYVIYIYLDIYIFTFFERWCFGATRNNMSFIQVNDMFESP